MVLHHRAELPIVRLGHMQAAAVVSEVAFSEPRVILVEILSRGSDDPASLACRRSRFVTETGVCAVGLRHMT